MPGIAVVGKEVRDPFARSETVAGEVDEEVRLLVYQPLDSANPTLDPDVVRIGIEQAHDPTSWDPERPMRVIAEDVCVGACVARLGHPLVVLDPDDQGKRLLLPPTSLASARIKRLEFDLFNDEAVGARECDLLYRAISVAVDRHQLNFLFLSNRDVEPTLESARREDPDLPAVDRERRDLALVLDRSPNRRVAARRVCFDPLG